jgi:hypothetical protein
MTDHTPVYEVVTYHTNRTMEKINPPVGSVDVTAVWS